MRHIAIVATSVALFAGAAAAQAQTFHFTTIDNPADLTFNQLLGINNAGVIAGYFGSSAVGHPNKGYTIAPPYTTFKPDNVPSSAQTQATGINGGKMITGFWAPTNLGPGLDANYGFIQVPDGNTFRYFDVNDPLVRSNPPINQVLGINNSGNAVGFYNDVNNASHGFAYLLKSGIFTPVNVPGAASAAATGINNSNLICGFFVNAHGRTLAFLKPEAGANVVKFSVPGSPTTQFLGVNNTGHAVGFFIGADTFPHGLYLDPATLSWVPVNDPHGAQGTILNGLNDKNQLVGFYMDAAGNTHGVLVTVTP